LDPTRSFFSQKNSRPPTNARLAGFSHGYFHIHTSEQYNMPRPKFKPSTAQREAVEVAAAVHNTHANIATAIGIDEKTLKLYFADELKYGRAKCEAKIWAAVYSAALDGNASAQRLIVGQLGVSPNDCANPPKVKRGKKEIANHNSIAAERGTSWEELVGARKRRSH
jgi:hypothetical protein